MSKVNMSRLCHVNVCLPRIWDTTEDIGTNTSPTSHECRVFLRVLQSGCEHENIPAQNLSIPNLSQLLTWFDNVQSIVIFQGVFVRHSLGQQQANHKPFLLNMSYAVKLPNFEH